jgi:superfamily I DNA and/or RNA helicase
MRPEIARLMKHFYDDLDNHISVTTDRLPIRGIDNNLFFIDHNYAETAVEDGSSKRNEFEGDYLIELAEYLIKQSYQPQQITILVMYLGQRQFIAKKVKERKHLFGIRIMVIVSYIEIKLID